MTITNPILPGFNPDPSILRVGTDYYLATSTFEWLPAVQLHHSTDLHSWRLIGHVLSGEQSPELRGIPSSAGVWAPSLTYDPVAQIFYVVYSIMKNQSGEMFDVDNFVVSAPDILGPWSAPVYLTSVGFMMNDQMDDFAVQPGKPNMFGLVQGEANAIQPGKRMLSAMSPTVVLDASGKVQMVAGAAGGPRIISATSQVILNVIEFGMPLADAMRAPRIHNQALPDELRLETNGFPAATIDSLKAMGHTVGFLGGIANVNAIRRVPGGWHGVSEPRAFGAAVGY